MGDPTPPKGTDPRELPSPRLLKIVEIMKENLIVNFQRENAERQSPRVVENDAEGDAERSGAESSGR
jgi:hypothetical protein